MDKKEEWIRDLTEEEKATLKNIIEELEKISIFTGKYDASATNSNLQSFMYGIATVMECLAYMVSDEYGDIQSNNFIQNMLESEKNILTKQ